MMKLTRRRTTGVPARGKQTQDPVGHTSCLIVYSALLPQTGLEDGQPIMDNPAVGGPLSRREMSFETTYG